MTEIQESKDGLPFISLTSLEGKAEICLHGAQVTRWQPGDGDNVIFVSTQSEWQADKPIRGGVPICFPWFGPHARDKDAPLHGWARLCEWQLQSAAEDEAVLSLERDGWQLLYRVRVGRDLELALEIRNGASHTKRCEAALHTYFAVGDIERVMVHGLAAAEYLDKTEDFARKTEETPALKIVGETDRIYFSHATVEIEDQANVRRIIVEKSGAGATVVWNPGREKAAAMPDFGDDEWRTMLCVETAAVSECALELAPNETHIVSARLRVS
ncbi:MAG TPA: D-hexose-6-phosphate mutarotase [Abditibacteriaceae bacterium]|jgi:glucose-6-phosphate 1-epimerase